MSPTDAQILTSMGLMCIHHIRASSVCEQCARTFPTELREDLKVQFHQIKTGLMRRPLRRC